MKIYDYDGIIADIKFDPRFINLDDVIDDDSNILLPYAEPNFLESIKCLMNNIALEADVLWKLPDYSRSKAYFYICKDCVDLSIEVFPKCYSGEERQYMIAAANRTLREDGISDYIEILNMFDEIDRIISTEDSIGEIRVYHLELNNEERDMLLTYYD